MDLGPSARLRLSPEDEDTHPVEAALSFWAAQHIWAAL